MKAQASSCLDTNSFASKLSYQWQLSPSAGINLPNTIRPTLTIPKQQLVGGRTYTATVRVAMQQDMSLAVTQIATIYAQASKVVALVSGVQTMSVLETINLSGKSFTRWLDISLVFVRFITTSFGYNKITIRQTSEQTPYILFTSR